MYARMKPDRDSYQSTTNSPPVYPKADGMTIEIKDYSRTRTYATLLLYCRDGPNPTAAESARDEKSMFCTTNLILMNGGLEKKSTIV